ncbi:MAG: hypothetical protein Q9221_008512 [Calogaya cf. arnoldii]
MTDLRGEHSLLAEMEVYDPLSVSSNFFGKYPSSKPFVNRVGTASLAYTGDGIAGNVFSVLTAPLAIRSSLPAEKDARVIFKVPIWGAPDPESLLSVFADEDPELEDFPSSLHHEDPLLLSLSIDIQLVRRTFLIRIELDTVDKADNTCYTCEETEAEDEGESQFLGEGHLQA